MALEWKLRKVMAEKNIWSGAELSRLLQDLAGYKLSAPSISALINEQPKQVKAETMDALCMALECTPSDLWVFTPTPYVKKKQQKVFPLKRLQMGKCRLYKCLYIIHWKYLSKSLGCLEYWRSTEYF